MRLVRDYAQTIPPINSIKDFTPGVELLQKILPYLNSKYEIIESRFISISMIANIFESSALSSEGFDILLF